MRAHLWTVWPALQRALRTPVPFAGERWQGIVHDPARGPIPLGGRLRRVDGADTLVLLVHGLGGSCDSPYQSAVARACAERGMASLRLGLRGSDGQAGDFYHAGLTADLRAALAAPEAAGYRHVCIVGFSLGGHVVLRYATEEHDPRLAAVATVCSPLDLQAAQHAIDAPLAWPYRRYLLRRLQRAYGEIARHGPVPTPVSRVLHTRTLREWDRLTVVPRFGFRDPEDYYARMSVGPRLGMVRVPALGIACPGDPMVAEASILAAPVGARATLDLRWVPRGGHVSFPSDLDLGMPGPHGLAGQLVAWLHRAVAATSEEKSSPRLSAFTGSAGFAASAD